MKSGRQNNRRASRDGLRTWRTIVKLGNKESCLVILPGLCLFEAAAAGGKHETAREKPLCGPVVRQRPGEPSLADRGS